MKKRNTNIPNDITILRIVGTLCLMPTYPPSPMFFAIYALTGLTDVLDGWIARKMGSASQFGAKLDSVADLIFYAVMLVKVFPILWIQLPSASAKIRVSGAAKGFLTEDELQAIYEWSMESEVL